LRVNNGKLLTNTNTFMILTSLSLTTYCYDGHNSHDSHGVITIDALAEPVGTLTTIDVNKSTQNNLLDR
jgi:hypothetical protein